ncbi:hypothetical protein GCM10010350_65900 [Streptomyces galilaeus]|nr:hypothetical protein GCM10010350_65900 [Streptomyces galilaeus]
MRGVLMLRSFGKGAGAGDPGASGLFPPRRPDDYLAGLRAACLGLLQRFSGRPEREHGVEGVARGSLPRVGVSSLTA